MYSRDTNMLMRNVITPLVGKRDMEAAAEMGSDINYIIDYYN